jgi:ATP-dependent HslUV protease ATP-binding subunit HslU
VPINDLIGKLGKMMNKKPEKRKMPISEARPLIEEIELDKLLDLQDVTREAVQAVEVSKTWRESGRRGG